MANVLVEFGPLYHKYSLFGVDNEQCPGIFYLNQKSKEKIILAYIMYAIAKCTEKTESKVSFVELFCADGYYAMAAKWFGAHKSFGIDNGRDKYFTLAEKIAARLGLVNIFFVNSDVNKIDRFPAKDIVANVGGLYHVENPEEILEKSYTLANRYLIVQSVVSMASNDSCYFQTPAPGWTWGSRYSRESFDAMIRAKGWNIISNHFNELEGNTDPVSRGSVYYLVQK